MNGTQLREGYINAGYSRRSFAEHLGITENALRRLESGEGVHPATAKKVADFFEVKVTDLMPLERAA